VLTNSAVAYAVAKFIHRLRIPLLESMAESVESELEVMKPLRKPGHQEQEQAEHYRSHSETGQRYRQMIPIELFKFISLHVFSLISTETGSRSALAHDPSAQNTVQFLGVLANSSEPDSHRFI
jgi:hypothetical protein